MKKVILAIVTVACACISSFAQTRTDSEGNTVHQPLFVVAQYQMGDFDAAKMTSSYGVGIVASSISHWGRFHVGADLNLGLNAGFVDDWGVIINFGPSGRVDITDRVFVNVPVNARCYVSFPEGSTSTETYWGMMIAPSIHAFITDRLGAFVGPQVTFDFSGDSSTSVGMQVGLSYSF